MSPVPHPKFEEIRSEIRKFSKLGRPFSGIGYRCVELQFARKLITGIGSQLHGARWTPRGSFPTVYLCDTAEGALQEYLARARRMNLSDHKALPMVMVWVRVKVRNLLDTTDPRIAAVINPRLVAERVHWREIQERREAVSQAIGRAINDICHSGLIAESSVMPGGKNIVVFPSKLGSDGVLSTPTLKPIR